MVNPSRRIRIVVADNTRMTSHLLAEALARDERLEVVGVCSTENAFAEAVESHSPDVVVLSVRMENQPLRGFDICRRLRSEHRATAIVILLDCSRRDLVLGAFAAGARGVFSRDQSMEMLMKCVCSVQAGQVWASSEEMHFVLEAFADATPPKLMDAKGAALLSPRELEVVQCVIEGLTNREIAARLRLSEYTVKNYIFRIFDKLGVSTRVELVLYAFSQRAGISEDSSRKGNGVGEGTSEMAQRHARAESGDCLAQLRLAESHRQNSNGQSVEKVFTAMWLALADRIGTAVSQTARASLKRILQDIEPEQQVQVDAHVQSWIARHQDLLTGLGKPAKRSSTRRAIEEPNRVLAKSSKVSEPIVAAS